MVDNQSVIIMEEWRDIPGFNGHYQVSNLGNARSVDREIVARRSQGVGFCKKKYKGRAIIQRNHPQGYLQIPAGVRRAILCHRAVAMAFIPNPLNKEFVNHIDGDKRNNCVDNLEWATRKENEEHAFATGLKNSSGSSNAMAKFTESDILDIRKKRLKDRRTYVDIAKEYGVHFYTIKRIVMGETWAHVA